MAFGFVEIVKSLYLKESHRDLCVNMVREDVGVGGDFVGVCMTLCCSYCIF